MRSPQIFGFNHKTFKFGQFFLFVLLCLKAWRKHNQGCQYKYRFHVSLSFNQFRLANHPR